MSRFFVVVVVIVVIVVDEKNEKAFGESKFSTVKQDKSKHSFVHTSERGV